MHCNKGVKKKGRKKKTLKEKEGKTFADANERQQIFFLRKILLL